MNDLDLLQQSVPDVALPSLTELSEARVRVVAGITSSGIAGRRTFPRQAAERLARKRRRLARRIVGGGVTVGGAGGVTGGLLLVGGTHAVVAVHAQLTAREVFDRAASAALRQPSVAPGPDQFVYTEVTGGGGSPVVR